MCSTAARFNAFPNYKIGIGFSHLLGASEYQFLVQEKLLSYKVNQKVYVLEAASELAVPVVSFDSNITNIPANVLNIDDLFQLREFARQYKYIALDDDLLGLLYGFGQVDVCPYWQSREGRMWRHIMNLFAPMVQLGTLSNLDAINFTQKLYEAEFFEYIPSEKVFAMLQAKIPALPVDYAEIQNNYDLKKKLYFFFFNKEPEYVPASLRWSSDLLWVDVQSSSSMIIDKSLLQYVREDSLYIGNDLVSDAMTQVRYCPRYMGYNAFPSFSLSLEVKEAENFVEEKNQKQGLLTKLYARQHGLSSNEYSLHIKYKKYVVNLLADYINNYELSNWDDAFKINKDFLKLLEKTRRILNVFCAFLKEKRIKSLKKCVFFNNIWWDFYSEQDMCLVDIITANTQIDSCYLKKKYCLVDYYLVTDSKILLIDCAKECKCSMVAPVLEDDLFGWCQWE